MAEGHANGAVNGGPHVRVQPVSRVDRQRNAVQAVQGGLLLIALIVMVVNLLVDLLYGLINPRIRHR